MPTRLGDWFPLTFKVEPTTPLITNDLIVEIFVDPGLPPGSSTYRECVMSVTPTGGGGETTYPVGIFMHGFGYWATAQVNFNEELSVSTLLFTCPLVIFNPANPQPIDQSYTTELSISITNQAASFDAIQFDHEYVIHNQEAMFHRYFWDHDHPGLISVEFTFYRPHGSTSTLHTIDHPLLDLGTVTSMHLSPSDHIQQDLGRLYNFIPPSAVSTTRCIDDYRVELDMRFSRTTVDSMKVSLFKSGSTRPTCKFVLRYPPDVVDYILENLTNPAITIYDESGHRTVTVPLDRPNIIPVHINTDDAIASPQPLQIWRAPHHVGNTHHFEFGIARSRYYLFQQDPLEVFQPILDFAFTFESQPVSSDLFKQVIDTIRCKSHHELDYVESPMTWDVFVSNVANGNGFDGLGKTCEVTFTAGDIPQTNAKYDHYIIQSFAYKTEDQDDIVIPLVKINEFYQSTSGDSVQYFLQDTSMVTPSLLPPIAPITFGKGIDLANQEPVIRATFNVQYLLPFHSFTYSSEQDPASIAFQFVFHQFTNGKDIKPSLDGRFPKLRILHDDYIIQDNLSDLRYYGATFKYDGEQDTLVYEVDPIETIFQPHRPIRSPHADIRWTYPSSIDPVVPFTVTVELPVPTSIQYSPGITYDVFVIVHPNPSRWDGQYHPEYALITPVRETPLTGYSYRCVTWDRMAAPYVYASTGPSITRTNSQPCSRYYTAGIPPDVSNPDIWRQSSQVFHRGYRSNLTPSCFYELAAVCVTPSTTNQGTYDVHPLADCPSFLGEIHAVPCSLVDDSNGSNESTWGYTLHPYEAQLSAPDGRPTVRLSWEYKGDPRLSVSIFAIAHYTRSNDEGTLDLSDPVLIATNAPSSLSLTALRTKRVKLPFFNSQRVKTITIKIVSESLPAIEETIDLIYSIPNDQSMNKCTDQYGKMIDDGIHLCVCQPGLRPSIPNGSDDPFVHPDDFTCENPCPSGFEWAHGECQCILDQDGCQHGGVCREKEDEDEDGHQCICIDGYYGDQCQYSGIDDLDPFCDELECVIEHTLAVSTTANEDGEEDENEEDPQHTCKIVVDPDDAATLIQCNCHPAYTGDRCELDTPDYIHPCAAGFEWNPKTRQCEPDLPDNSVCHSFSETVLPPFFTNHCGYGVPSGAKCDECSCLSRWVQDPTSDDKKCSRCKLEYGAPDEQCMKNGHTSEITYSPLLCWVGRCLCNPGYYGPKCQHKVMYGTLDFLKTLFTSLSTPSTSSSAVTASLAPLSLDSTDTTTILTRAQLQELEARVVGPITDAIHAYGGFDLDNPVILNIQQATQTVTIINSDSDNNNENDGEEEPQEPTEQQQQIMTTIVIAIQLPRHDNNNDNDNTDGNGDGNDNNGGNPFIQFNIMNEVADSTSLYDAWEQLQETGIPEDSELGAVKNIQPVYDPHCVPNEFIACPNGQNNLLPPEQQVDPNELEDIYVEEEPDSEDPDNPIIDISNDDESSNTTTYIIIGVVVGVVLILFILLVIAIIYCRKYNKMCFDTTKGKRSGKNQQGKSSQTNGVELTASGTSGGVSPSTGGGSTTTAAGSSNLPTQVAVDDPTLPADWIALEDKSTGKIYYSNQVTMVSSWDHPAKVKDEDENEYGW